MAGAETTRKTRITEGWQPSPDQIDFAEKVGIADVDAVADSFRDHHLMHGKLMASWAAAWRTWCRNQVKFGHASGQRHLPLLAIASVPDPADPYGAKAWAARLPDARPDTLPGGIVAMCVGGYDAAGTARDLCEAVGLPPDWRGDLAPIAEWLRAGLSPDAILEAVIQGGQPRISGSWRYYDARVRQIGNRSQRFG